MTTRSPRFPLLAAALLLASLALTAGCSTAPQTANHNAVHDMGNMNHTANQNAAPDMSKTGHEMMQSSPNAAQAPYDLQFLDTMSAHHQGAVDMALPVAAKAQSPELKAFAAKIIVAQKKEIADMKAWREAWYKGQPPALNMEMSGMMASMMGMDMKKLDAASGKDFDLMFLEMMTPHHQGAITMSQEALSKAQHPEIKQLARGIITAQEAEIKQMQAWQKQWSK